MFSNNADWSSTIFDSVLPSDILLLVVSFGKSKGIEGVVLSNPIISTFLSGFCFLRYKANCVASVVFPLA